MNTTQDKLVEILQTHASLHDAARKLSAKPTSLYYLLRTGDCSENLRETIDNYYNSVSSLPIYMRKERIKKPRKYVLKGEDLKSEFIKLVKTAYNYEKNFQVIYKKTGVHNSILEKCFKDNALEVLRKQDSVLINYSIMKKFCKENNLLN